MVHQSSIAELIWSPPCFFRAAFPKHPKKGPRNGSATQLAARKAGIKDLWPWPWKLFPSMMSARLAVWKYTYIYIYLFFIFFICENLLPLSLVSRSRCSSICKNNLLNCPKYPKKEHAQTRGSFINGTSPENDQRTFITRTHRESMTVYYSWR